MRILLRALALLVAAGLLFIPALAGLLPTDSTTVGPDPVRISDYTADYVVTAEGDLVAKEQITTEFPGGRHGIFRFWPMADPSDKNVRLIPKDVTVRLDGGSVPFDMQWQKGRQFRVAKIGDPDSFVTPGTHVYTITYRIDGALAPSTAGPGTFASSSWTDKQPAQSVFYWNVVGQGWQMDIDKSTINIALPADSGKVQCTSSFDGSGTCDISGAGTDKVTIKTDHLSPRTPVTVRIGLPIETPDRVTVPWPVAADRALGTSTSKLGIVLAIALGAMAFGYYLDRRSREETPGQPVMYEPPPGLGPVQTAYVTTERTPGRSLVATLLYQAEQGLTTLTDNGSKSWTITGVGDADAWAKTDDVTRFVGESLGVTQPGAHFKSSPDSVTSGQKLQSVRNAISARTNAWADGIGAQRRSAVHGDGRDGCRGPDRGHGWTCHPYGGGAACRVRAGNRDCSRPRSAPRWPDRLYGCAGYPLIARPDFETLP